MSSKKEGNFNIERSIENKEMLSKKEILTIEGQVKERELVFSLKNLEMLGS